MQNDVMMGMGETRPQEIPAGVPRSGSIKIHGEAAFEGMRKAGILAAATLDFITSYVVPGVTTGELDRLCHEYIVGADAIPAPLGYRGFPKSICTSINHVVCHGIPGDRRLMEGDTLNIDVTVIVDGWHGDTSRMYFVGDRVPLKARKLASCATSCASWALPASQRASRARKSGNVGGLRSALPSSSAQPHTPQPAARSRAAST